MEHRRAPSDPARTFRVLADRTQRRRRCLLTDLHPERGLSSVLRRNLTAVLPDVEFTLEPAEGLDVVWVCGYEPRALDTIAELRRLHPDCMLLVTSRRRDGDEWIGDVLAAGADHALEWPCSFSSLSSLLSRDPRELSN